MAMLNEKVKKDVKKILGDLSGPVKLVFFKENLNCETCESAEKLAKELSDLSAQLSLEIYDRLINEDKAKEYKVDKSPALVLEGPAGARVRFFGLASGFEFASLLEGLKDVASGKTDLSKKAKVKLAALSKDVHIQVFVTPSCPYCPGAVRTAHKLATEYPQITGDMVEAQEFPDLSQKYGLCGVPMIIINDKVGFTGSLPDTDFADAILKAVA